MKESLALSVPGYGELSIPTASASSGVDINTIFQFSVNLLITVGFVTALIYLMLAGIKWITSGGDKEKIEGARKGVMYSIIGLVIILLSFIIINIIGQILGVWQLEQFGLKSSEQSQKPNDPDLPTPTRRPVTKPKS